MSQSCSVLKMGMRAVPEVYGFCWCCLDTWLEGGGLFFGAGGNDSWEAFEEGLRLLVEGEGSESFQECFLAFLATSWVLYHKKPSRFLLEFHATIREQQYPN